MILNIQFFLCEKIDWVWNPEQTGFRLCKIVSP